MGLKSLGLPALIFNQNKRIMFEKVNPQHPDKVADRIAGAIVDLAYAKSENPKVAAEVLLGHGLCSLQIETSERLTAVGLSVPVNREAA